MNDFLVIGSAQDGQPHQLKDIRSGEQKRIDLDAWTPAAEPLIPAPQTQTT